MSSPADEAVLLRARWQPVVFARAPRRSELLRLSPSWPLHRVNLRVFRNEPFEFVASALPGFAAFAGLDVAVTLSDYDDSLSFQTVEGAADVELLWLDLDRYRERFTPEELSSWLRGRILARKARSDAPLLIADSPEESEWARALNHALSGVASALPGVLLCDRSAVAQELSAGYRDARAARISGTTVSDAAHLSL